MTRTFPRFLQSTIVAALLQGVAGQGLAAQSGSVAPPGRLVDVGGYRIHLWCRGEGSPTLVVEAGAGAWSISFARIQDSLSRVTRVCLYDRAGLGWSEESPKPGTAEGAADNLVRLLKAASTPPPSVLLGHSYGAWVVRVAAGKPARQVAGVVFLDGAHPEQWRRLPPGALRVVDASVPGLRAAAQMAERGGLRPSGLDPEPFSTLGRQWRPAYEQSMLSAKRYRATAEEFAETRVSADQAAQAPTLGTLPLWVVTAGRSFFAFEGTGLDLEAGNRVWLELQGELLSLSSASTQVLSPCGTHPSPVTTLRPCSGCCAKRSARFARRGARGDDRKPVLSGERPIRWYEVAPDADPATGSWRSDPRRGHPGISLDAGG